MEAEALQLVAKLAEESGLTGAIALVGFWLRWEAARRADARRERLQGALLAALVDGHTQGPEAHRELEAQLRRIATEHQHHAEAR